VSNVIAASSWRDPVDPYTRDTFDVDDAAARIVETGSDVSFLSYDDAVAVAEYAADIYGVDATVHGGPDGFRVVLKGDAEAWRSESDRDTFDRAFIAAARLVTP
jgi:hypothetical protein